MFKFTVHEFQQKNFNGPFQSSFLLLFAGRLAVRLAVRMCLRLAVVYMPKKMHMYP